MKQSVPLWVALLLGGCSFPYTPRALPSLSVPDPAAAAPATPYTPPRQTELASAMPVGDSPENSTCLSESFATATNTGWPATSTASVEPENGADHSYDSTAPEVRPLLVAQGRVFVARRRLAAFDHVAVPPVVCDLLSLPPTSGLDRASYATPKR